MKDSFVTILPTLPIVGNLKLSRSSDGLINAIYPTLEKCHKKFHPLEEEAYEKLLKYLSGGSKIINLPVKLEKVSPFQKSLLNHLKEIPFGSVRSYKELAVAMDSKAYQAIGSACGKNPLLLIYPCHRVIGSQGMGGFAHGLKMKRSLLELEGVFLT
jgi:O-6-methylguanine DNA methyltransferase